MTSINYNEFQAGQGVSAPALNENFTMTNTAIETLEAALNTSAASKASKNGSLTEKFSVANATETTHAINLGQLNAVSIPVGTVIWFAKDTAPTGYLICNGSAVSRTDYADLFEKIGTTFDVEGTASDKFCVPDLIGKTVYGSTTLNDNSLNTGNQSADHIHHTENVMGGSANKASNNQESSHTHAVPAVSLLPCIKY